MRLYIDYIGSNINGMTKHGGANYSKSVILSLIKSVENQQITVIWPAGYKPADEDERTIYRSSNIEIREMKEIDGSLDIKVNDVIFFPLLRTRRYPILKSIKEWYPQCRLYLTNHDVRPLDLRPDSYSRYYEKHYSYPLEILKHKLQAFVYKGYMRKYYTYTDKIFTVSNDAMQKITKITSVNYINYYYENTLIEKSEVKSKIGGDYILFVSGKVPTKNFARALEAFCKYKQERDNAIYLVVTGMTDEAFKYILRNNQIDKEIVNKWVIKYSYVEKQMLQDLYSQCRYLLYPSLNEGFGLPVLEAAICGKKSLCSYVSSVPEVLGSVCEYVNPYSVEAIKNGLIEMEERYVPNALFREKVNCMLEISEIDMKVFIDELIN